MGTENGEASVLSSMQAIYVSGAEEGQEASPG
jgi:hypothetical protein